MRLATVFPIIALLIAIPASAGMYKWTDADGNVQYGQYPPAGADAKPMKPAPPPASAPARKPLNDQVEALNKQMDARKQKEAEAAEDKKQAEFARTNCENAKKNIEQLNLGGHRLAQMPDGSYKRFSEEEKQAAIAKNKQAIDEFCK